MLLMTGVKNAYSQAEVEPWGNITGIRVQGQLFDFESSLRVISADGLRTVSTGKERQQPHYKRKGNTQEITTRIDSLYVKESVTDIAAGRIGIVIQVTAHKDTAVKGLYFCISLPQAYTGGKFRLFDSQKTELNTWVAAADYTTVAKGVEFTGTGRRLLIKFDEPTRVMVKKEAGNNIRLLVTVKEGALPNHTQAEKSYTIEAAGDIDQTPVNLTINTNKKGRAFDGLGGNFRLQNPKTDPQVIDYCLQNLRVAWGRVEMPWRFWQPDKDTDPVATAESGKISLPVKKAMEMAHRLDSMRIPVILSAWFPPDWAIEGPPNLRPVNGVWGNKLDKGNMEAIYKSIADYILYLKNKYGVQVKLFSFNESDLGINVRVTAQEHDDFIKGCGAYFAAHGVQTKMLLGDNSDATTYAFIYPALHDAAAKPYIGAVSFHSWRGWDDVTLGKWAEAANTLGVPLIVGEGSIDAAAYSYPDIFQEPTYALQEINLYTRLLAICQPESILQWQLTADYSPLIGGGIFGNDEPLHPGQRFWNLKQLAATPKGLFALPVTCDRPNISCAALGDNAKGQYAVHLVNNGATRMVTLRGLPPSLKALNIYTTSKELNMEKGSALPVKNGEVKFELRATSFTTLTTE